MGTDPEDVYAIYKPKGPTSHDIVDSMRRITGERRVGHAGTLDPAACGVLVVGVGRTATKTLHDVVATEKEYVAVVRLGEESSTDDGEGEREKRTVERIPSPQDVAEAIKKFTGAIMQKPPKFSALKIRGVPAYKLAREKKEVEFGDRPVTVYGMHIIRYAWPLLELRATTGPGVYIRALARDMGIALGVGGYLKDIERTRVGEFTKDRAQTLEQFADYWRRRGNGI